MCYYQLSRWNELNTILTQNMILNMPWTMENSRANKLHWAVPVIFSELTRFTWLSSSDGGTEPLVSSFFARLDFSFGFAWYLDLTSGGRSSRGTTPSIPNSVNCKTREISSSYLAGSLSNPVVYMWTVKRIVYHTREKPSKSCLAENRRPFQQ